MAEAGCVLETATSVISLGERPQAAAAASMRCLTAARLSATLTLASSSDFAQSNAGPPHRQAVAGRGAEHALDVAADWRGNNHTPKAVLGARGKRQGNAIAFDVAEQGLLAQRTLRAAADTAV